MDLKIVSKMLSNVVRTEMLIQVYVDLNYNKLQLKALDMDSSLILESITPKT
jgi:hypothetical protein